MSREKELIKEIDEHIMENSGGLYGLELPDSDLKIIRAALAEKEAQTGNLTSDGIDRNELMSELSEIFQDDTTNDRFNYVLELADRYAEHEARQEVLKDPTIESHSDADITQGCIDLMNQLVGRFEEYMDLVDIQPESEEERFQTSFTNAEIVQRLLLWKTSHSGGTSTWAKCRELGLDPGEEICFEDDRDKEDDE